MNDFKRYLVTSALPYANGLKHIGHLAGAYIPADIYVRYLRAQKRDVVFVCGSDEHGTAIPIQATKEHTTPRAIIDKYHEAMKQDFADLNISFDIYHRTSDPLHHETAQEFFTYLHERNELETKETEQFYDEATKTFLADRYIKGTCPNCGSDRAFGDQCENCGRSLSPDELINPVSTLSGQPPVKRKTTHWYLPLDRHEEFLRQWILEQHKDDWRPTVVGQCKSWIEGGLQPRAVTRDLDWGIKVPLKDAEGKVLYVWFDAPIGYISATRQWAIDNKRDWKPYWYEKDTKLVHFIGKDNIVFHCIIFPVMLKLHGNILPENVPANEFLNLEGDKMSTSRNWKLEMRDYINDFVKQENGGGQCVDMLRYYLTQIAPETKDSEFTWKGFQDAVNSELVSIFGNFVNRTFVLMHKLCGGKVPPFHNDIIDDIDKQLITDIASAKEKIESLIEQYKFREALYEVIDLSRKGNQYMQKKEPWILAKQLAENPAVQQQIDNSLHLCLQLTANLAIFIHPFLPSTAHTMLHMMKVVEKMLDWDNAGKMKLLSVGYSLREPRLLFRKIEDTEIAAQVEKLKAGLVKATTENTLTETTDNAPAPVKETIQFDDFAKIDLRVATITAAGKVPKADKLLQLEVDLGFEKRTIVSGIALHFAPEDIIGQQVVIVANLAPRKMRGIESNGMILMAEDKDGKLRFVSPAEAVASGSGVS
ncbi:MAG: methionine--tRNA ligase [Sphingobacteriales bacterium SCN 48-20]|uniref:methionine--tRNA ligase n=1 Tax=Terrimonas ferruginea TaxID=249 RepID=UPI00086EBD8A|nr:methionine--tRNA ligase [Terrimonas ferruginea]MBN8783335.1 methionine--tRNA ligase [Terrimonas ferruginea]ODT95169.1 MAG: methionine--tRNA ligase [Sphingobacteriales bacterium SCN 48-20]OJW39951.1 MAG: methionine--tRNA ligase [Sphingobacteriales bacterium 48-107]